MMDPVRVHLLRPVRCTAPDPRVCGTTAPVPRLVIHNKLTSSQRRWCSSCLRTAYTPSDCAGIQGCGIDSAGGPAGTVWKLPFVVFDSHMPAARDTLVKTVTLLTPCASFTDVYCPGAAAPCGPTPCSLRPAAVPAEAEIPPPSINVNTSLLLPGTELIYGSDGSETIVALSPCTRMGSLPLPACTVEATSDTAAAVQNTSGGMCAVIVHTGLTLQEPPRVVATGGTCGYDDAAAGRCSVCSPPALAAGECAPSTEPFVFELHATDSRGQSARPLAMHVTLWNISAVSELVYRLELAPETAADRAALEELEVVLVGTATASPLARALLLTYWEGVWVVPACAAFADRVLLHTEVSEVAVQAARGGVGASAVARMRVTLGLDGGVRNETTVLCLSHLGLLHGAEGLVAAWELVAGPEWVRVLTRMVLDSSYVQQAQCTVPTVEETQAAWLKAEMEKAKADAREALLMLVRLPLLVAVLS